MARVYNWQIGRDMSYWYPESRPKRQFAAIFDINKCIACQTCTLACKTTWTSGKGQEYMLWNNVESKPYGCYPLAWDSKLLSMLGAKVEGQHVRRPHNLRGGSCRQARSGLAARELDYANPNVGEDDCTGVKIEHGASLQVPHLTWFFYLRGSAIIARTRRALLPARVARSTSGPRMALC